MARYSFTQTLTTIIEAPTEDVAWTAFWNGAGAQKSGVAQMVKLSD